MSIYDCELWTEDLDRVIKSMPWISSLSGKTIMITGIGGLVCSAIADILIRYNETCDDPVTILAAARNEKTIQDRFGQFADRSYFQFMEYDATGKELRIPYPVDYIIHGAGNSSPDMISKEPVETLLGNIMGTYNLLKFAKEKSIKRLLFISSSEVYGKKDGNEPFREDQYGAVDILKSRNSYAVAKRAAESLCVSFADEYGVSSVLIRPGHIYGPTAKPNDKHVAAQWAYDAAFGRDLVMKSNGAQLRSYCYCLDCASAILTTMLKGEDGRAYNISNPDSVISIRQMAEILAKSAGVNLIVDVPTEDEKKSFNPMSNSSLDSSSLIELGWKGCFDAPTGLDHTVRILKKMHV